MQPGVHTMSAEEYHADPCEHPSLSASIAHILCVSSPLHAWAAHPRLNPAYKRQEKQQFDIGTAAHALLLEGVSAVQVIDAPDWRTRAAREARDEARAAGLLPLLQKHSTAVLAMYHAAKAQLEQHDAEPPPFTGGQPEQTLVWQEDDVTCRARLDWLRDDRRAVDDYKTTSASAEPGAFSRRLFGSGFDVQAAFYLRGLEALTGERAEWRWVVQEVQPPYALSVVSLTPAALELAAAKVDYAISLWRECIATDTWPGYPLRVCYAELPGWEESRWLEREAREELAA